MIGEVLDNSTELVGRLRRLPQRMQQVKQWLVWRFESYEGDKKPRKVPYYISGWPRRGKQGSPEDRSALATFEVALKVLVRGARGLSFDGIGFAFLPDDGLIGIDIDGAIDPESGEVSELCERIVRDCNSYTELSPSGRGVHIIVEGQSATFKDNSIGLEVFCGRQFFTCSGRLWGGAEAPVRPISAEVLQMLETTVRGERTQAVRTTPARARAQPVQGVEYLQRKIESALPFIAPEAHDTWITMGMAIKAALGDSGFGVWDHWSSRSGKYPGAEPLRRRWDSFKSGGVTEASIFKAAMEQGWKPPRPARPAATAPAAEPRVGAKAPAPQTAAVSTPAPGSAEGGKKRGSDIPAVLASVFVRGAKGGVQDCRENVYHTLRHHPDLQGLVGYDEFAHRVMKRRDPPWPSDSGEWTTQDDYALGLWMTQNLRLEIRSESTLMAGVAMAAYEGRFHPVRDYLDSLPAWDGVERLAHWLAECLGAAEPTIFDKVVGRMVAAPEYLSLVGTWFVMGLVRRVRQPGCQMDYMIVLEGLQGKRKSTSLRTLVGNDDWFADTPIRIGDKDALLSLAGKWLYEVGELDSFNRAEATAVKQYVSSRIDRVREPFARRPADRPRSCVFAGTTNQGEYFKDPTGARRFWPVRCEGEIDLAKLASWRDQLFAEAMWRLAHEDEEIRRCWPTRTEEERFLVPEQEQREIADPWFERIAVWVESDAKFRDTSFSISEMDELTTHDILTSCLMVPIDRIDGGRQMATRVGIAMHKLGWTKRRESGGSRLWKYVRPAKAESGGPALPAAFVAGGPAEGV